MPSFSPPQSPENEARVLSDYEELMRSQPTFEAHKTSTSYTPTERLRLAMERTKETHRRMMDAEVAAIDEARNHFDLYRRSLATASSARQTAELFKVQYDELTSICSQLESANVDGQHDICCEEVLSENGCSDEVSTEDPAQAGPSGTSQDAPPSAGPSSAPPSYEEDPPSPPPTAAPPILSPPPLAYRRHAGHTPGAPASRSKEASPGDQTPKASDHNSTPPAADPLPAQHAPGEHVLAHPLGLTRDPEVNTTPLEKLQQSLEKVQQDPEGSKPAVVKAVEKAEAKAEEATAQKKGTSQGNTTGQETAASQENRGPPTIEEELADDDFMPPLKFKRSMNFYAPLGSLGNLARRRSDSR